MRVNVIASRAAEFVADDPARTFCALGLERRNRRPQSFYGRKHSSSTLRNVLANGPRLFHFLQLDRRCRVDPLNSSMN